MDRDQKASAQSRKSSPTHTGRRYLEKGRGGERGWWEFPLLAPIFLRRVVSKAVNWELGRRLACALVCFSVHLLKH